MKITILGAEPWKCDICGEKYASKLESNFPFILGKEWGYTKQFCGKCASRAIMWALEKSYEEENV